MVVMAIMGILLALVSLGLQAVLGTAFGGEVSDLANTLVRARAYAMANNTYVFVGIEEVDASVAASTTPQVVGNGRLGVSVVASNDGTRGYDPNNLSGSFPATSVPQTTLNIVSPAQHFENLHLLTAPSASVLAKLPYSGTTGVTPINVASGTSSFTAFSWPIGATGSAAQYSFGTAPGSVIQFDPQGQAQIISTTSGSSVLQWIELDLEPTHGKTVPAPGTPAAANAATILIDGPSGSVSLYRT
jgi:hypothetical protein